MYGVSHTQAWRATFIVRAARPGLGRPAAGAHGCTDVGGRYAADEKSAATRRAYRSDWAHFTRWCDGMGATALPASPQTVAGYLAHLADSGLKASTIGRRMAAIAYAHRLKEFGTPTASEAVHAVARGIRRRIGVASAQKAWRRRARSAPCSSTSPTA
jgi:Phage integrase, N-terminal SAM-like domain